MARVGLAPAFAALLLASCTRAEAQDRAPPPMHHAAHGDAPTPSGLAPVMLDPARSGGLSLATVAVEERAFEKTLRTVGVVALDETRTAHVHAKVRGVVESVQADFIGKPVRAGAALCGIYSQPVYAAELELVTLLEERPGDDDAKRWAGIVDAARQRLRLWDVPQTTIDAIERTRRPVRTFALTAPRTGIVVAKTAFVGNYVEPGTELYVVSDVRKLWVLVDLYEADVPYVHVGDGATLAVEGVAKPIAAKVSFLPPTIDEATRTLKARFDVDDRDGSLRPGAFVTAELRSSMGRGLAIPEDAVLRAGRRDVVFVVHGGVHVVPREVVLGPVAGDQVRVDAGLAPGELVAIRAQFLLDSESQLTATSPGEGSAHVGHGGH